jgi:hypothetical protein
LIEVVLRMRVGAGGAEKVRVGAGGAEKVRVGAGGAEKVTGEGMDGEKSVL